MSKYIPACKYISTLNANREPTEIYVTGSYRGSESYDNAHDAFVESIKIAEAAKSKESDRWSRQFIPIVLKEVKMTEDEK